MSRVSHWIRARNGIFRRASGIPMTDRGFRYGMAIFETIGVRNGRAIFLAEHLESAFSASVASGFRVDREWFDEAAAFLPCTWKPTSSGVARIHVTAGDGAPTDPARRCRMIISFEERRAVSPEIYARGYRLLSCPPRFLPTLDGRKTHNYWMNIAGLQSVKAHEGDEGLVFGPSDNLISACMANVFVVNDRGELITPGRQSGAREGVVGNWVIEQADVRTLPIKRREVQHAREIFLTNSWLGIMPATTLDGRKLPERAVSERLMQLYQCSVLNTDI